MLDLADVTKHITLRHDDENWDTHGDTPWIATIADAGNTPLANLFARSSHPLVALSELIRHVHDFYDDALADDAS